MASVIRNGKWLNEFRGDSLKANLLRGATGNFALKVVSTMLGLGVSILLARLLGAEGYGIYAYALALVGFLSLPAQFGLPSLLVREVAVYQAQENWGLLRGLLHRANRIVLLLSLLVILLAGAATLIFAGRLPAPSLHAFWLALPLIPLGTLAALRSSTLMGLGYIVQGQMPGNLVRPATMILLAGGGYLVFGAGGFGPLTAVGLQITAAALTLLVTSFMLLRYLPQKVHASSPDFQTRTWIKSAFPFFFLGGVYIISDQTDIVMLGILRSSEEVGIYSVMTTGAKLITFFLVAANVTIGPTIARLYKTGEMEQLQRTITGSARGAFLFTLPAALILMIAGKWVIEFLYGAEFAAGATALAILCGGQLLNVAAGSVGLILNMTGHEKDSAKGVAFAALLNIILNALLIPLWGLNGAAIATATSLVVWNVILTCYVKRRLGLKTTALGFI